MTSFLPAFKRLKENCPNDFELVGDNLIVEVLPAAEQKTKGGIFIPTSSKVGQIDGIEANRPCVVRVLLVGNGYFDDLPHSDLPIAMTDEDRVIPLESVPGELVMVGRMAISHISTFGPLVSNSEAQLARTKESEIFFRFKGEDAYQRCIAALEETVAPAVAG